MNRLLFVLACGIVAVVAMARPGEIRPGELWYDTAGHVINAHGGGDLNENFGSHHPVALGKLADYGLVNAKAEADVTDPRSTIPGAP